MENEYIPREKCKYLNEVHVSGTCIDTSTNKVLLTKRSSNKDILPNMIECCGGQLWPNESFQDSVRRHYKTQLGIDIGFPILITNILSTYKIHLKDTIIPGVRVACCFVSGNLIKELEGVHDWAEWFTFDEFKKIESQLFVPDLYEFVETCLLFFKRYE